MQPTSLENQAGSVGLSLPDLQGVRESAQDKIGANTGLPVWDLTDPSVLKSAVAANSPLTSSVAGIRPAGNDDLTAGAFSAMAGAVDNERALAAYYAGIQANRRIAPVVGYARIRDLTPEGQYKMARGLPAYGHMGDVIDPGLKDVPIRWGGTLQDSLAESSDLQRDNFKYFASKFADNLTFGASGAAVTGDWDRQFEEAYPQDAQESGTIAQGGAMAAFMAGGGPIMETGERLLSPITRPIGQALQKIAGEPLGRFLAAGLKKIYRPLEGAAVSSVDWVTQALGKTAAESVDFGPLRSRVTQLGGKFFRDADGFGIHLPADTSETLRQEIAGRVRAMRAASGGADAPIRVTSKAFLREPGTLERAAAQTAAQAFGYTKMATEMAAVGTAVPALIHAGKALAAGGGEAAESEAETAAAYAQAFPQTWWQTEKFAMLAFLLPSTALRAAGGEFAPTRRPPADIAVPRPPDRAALEADFIRTRTTPPSSPRDIWDYDPNRDTGEIMGPRQLNRGQ